MTVGIEIKRELDRLIRLVRKSERHVIAPISVDNYKKKLEKDVSDSKKKILRLVYM